jgi:hypothetical protein
MHRFHVENVTVIKQNGKFQAFSARAVEKTHLPAAPNAEDAAKVLVLPVPASNTINSDNLYIFSFCPEI